MTALQTPSLAARPAPLVNMSTQLSQIRRDLARGGDPEVLLGRLVDLALSAFSVKLGGVQRDSTKQWYLPTGASTSMAQELNRAIHQAAPHQWLISVPLLDEDIVLGRLTMVASTVNRSASQSAVGLDTHEIIETASLLLLSSRSGTATSAPASPLGAVTRTARDDQTLAEIRRDILANRFVPHYQPVVELGTEQVVAFEALARWQHPDRGWVPAAEFIELAERADLIADIQSAIFRLAAERARGWLDGGMKRVRVNLKLSTAQLQSPRLIDYLTRLTATYKLPSSTLGLLMTEAMMTETNSSGAVRALTDAGFRVTLEGLSASFSSAQRLRDLPLYGVKVDRTIVSRLATDPAAVQAARSAIMVARTLGVRTIADGVETPTQREVLTELKCDAALGFYWSPAVESEVANSMMRFQPFASRLEKRDSLAKRAAR